MKISITKQLCFAAVTFFMAHAASALTVERMNLSVGGGIFKPALIVTDGPNAGTYFVGENDLTAMIFYNDAALKAWAAGFSGVSVDDVYIFLRDYGTPGAPVTPIEPVTPVEEDPQIPSIQDNCQNNTGLPGQTGFNPWRYAEVVPVESATPCCASFAAPAQDVDAPMTMVALPPCQNPRKAGTKV